MVAEYVAGAVAQRYVFGAGADEPLVWYQGSGTASPTWLTADERGSIVGLAGAVQAINFYDEYGTPATANRGRFQYTGQMWIPEIGLYHYKARTYSPALGRFLQSDPAGYAAGTNLYAYASEDPINGADPTGLDDDIQEITINGGSGGVDFGGDWHSSSSNMYSVSGASPGIRTLFTGSHIPLNQGQHPTQIIYGPGTQVGGVPVPSTPPLSLDSDTQDAQSSDDAQLAQAFPDTFFFARPPVELVRPPSFEWPEDPTVPPAEGFEWRGKPDSQPGDSNGNWYNPETGESIRPDLDHPEPIGPHQDYRAPNGDWYRWYQDGRFVPKGLV